jgi:uncharacterized membrane protein
MGKNQLVLSFFENEAAADAAVTELKAWDKLSDDVKLGAIGVLVLDDKGKVKTSKLGARSTGHGAGIGLILVLLTPVGLIAGVVGGAVLGALHHRGLSMSKEDRANIGTQLEGGKAAVGVLVKPEEAAPVAAKLTGLGGSSKTHDLPDADVEEAATAAAAEPEATAEAEEAAEPMAAAEPEEAMEPEAAAEPEAVADEPATA